MSPSMIPNLITTIRIIGSFCLLFVQPLGKAFYIIYSISGLSDALDGYVARKTNSISELGSKLDSIADLCFYIMMILRIFPVLFEKLPIWIWYMVLTVAVLRIASYTVSAVKFKQPSLKNHAAQRTDGLFRIIGFSRYHMKMRKLRRKKPPKRNKFLENHRSEGLR